MRISVTGKPEGGGFTLLEVLGIIVLLGLASTLVYPSFAWSQEKVRLQYIGKLLRTDLQQVQEDAITEREPLTVTFADKGYLYSIGNRTITRIFYDYGFKFDRGLSGEAAEQWEEAAAAQSEIKSEAQAASKPEVAAATVLTFAPDGSCTATSLNWTSDHFQGCLAVRSDGTVSWTYGKKTKK